MVTVDFQISLQVFADIIIHGFDTFDSTHADEPVHQDTPEASTFVTLSTPKKRQRDSTDSTDRHSKVRKIAVGNFIRAANRQQVNFDRQKGGMKDDYVRGDTVGVSIAKEDRSGIGMKLLPCKVLEKTHDKFRLYSKSGILSTTFRHTDIHDMRNIHFPDLEQTDAATLDTIKMTAASRLNSNWKNLQKSTRSICNCNGHCMDKRCHCFKNNLKCSTKCHSQRQCKNK